MHKLRTLVAVSLLTGVGLAASSAQAGPVPPSDPLKAAVGELDLVVPAQIFIWSGRRYCFYPDGWHGPGFYWCGYAWRRGYGWGGPTGWHGHHGPAHHHHKSHSGKGGKGGKGGKKK